MASKRSRQQEPGRSPEVESAVAQWLVTTCDSPDDIALSAMARFHLSDRASVAALVQRVVGQVREQQRDWPRPTDGERLDRAFAILCARGILCRHAVGVTRSDGYHEVMSEAHGARGIAYYTLPDLHRAGDGKLLLSAGAIDELASSQAVMMEVVDVLRGEGLDVRWDGNSSAAIEIVGDWSFPRDEHGFSAAKAHPLHRSEVAARPPPHIVFTVALVSDDDEELRRSLLSLVAEPFRTGAKRFSVAALSDTQLTLQHQGANAACLVFAVPTHPLEARRVMLRVARLVLVVDSNGLERVKAELVEPNRPRVEVLSCPADRVVASVATVVEKVGTRLP